MSVDYSSCYYKCEGVDIIGYDEKDKKNRMTTEEIEKLFEQYNKYKEVFNFPTKYKGKILLKASFSVAKQL